jgi:hypothetical protein
VQGQSLSQGQGAIWPSIVATKVQILQRPGQSNLQLYTVSTSSTANRCQKQKLLQPSMLQGLPRVSWYWISHAQPQRRS